MTPNEKAPVSQRGPAHLAAQVLGDPSPEQTTWTPEELPVFLELAQDHRYGPLMRSAAMTGLRRSELCGLRWADVDLDTASLTVRQSVQLVGGRIVVGDVKTARSRRRLDLDAGTVAILRAHRRSQASEPLMVGAGWKDHGLVFCAPDGRPLHPDTITQWFERAVRRTELTRIRLHDLRHTHATHLLAAGVNVKIVSERWGTRARASRSMSTDT